MKVGDRLHVKNPMNFLITGRWSYFFVPGDMYEITYVHGDGCFNVQNTNGDGVKHYIYDVKERFYTKDEFRENKLKEIGL